MMNVIALRHGIDIIRKAFLDSSLSATIILEERLCTSTKPFMNFICFKSAFICPRPRISLRIHAEAAPSSIAWHLGLGSPAQTQSISQRCIEVAIGSSAKSSRLPG
eukprot:66352-Hanusia_phi.AAC.1